MRLQFPCSADRFVGVQRRIQKARKEREAREARTTKFIQRPRCHQQDHALKQAVPDCRRRLRYRQSTAQQDRGSIWYEHRSVSALEAFKANCSDRQPPDGHRESIQTVTTGAHHQAPLASSPPQARIAHAAARSCSPGRSGHKLARCGRVSGRAIPLGRTGRRPQPAGVPDTSLTTTSEPVAAGKRCCDSVYGGAAISTGAAIGTVHRRQRRVQRT